MKKVLFGSQQERLFNTKQTPPSCASPPLFTLIFEWFSPITAVQPLDEGKRHSALPTWQINLCVCPLKYAPLPCTRLLLCVFACCGCVCMFRVQWWTQQAQCIFGTDGCVAVASARCRNVFATIWAWKPTTFLSSGRHDKSEITPPTRDLCRTWQRQVSLWRNATSVFPLGLVMGLWCCCLPCLVLLSATPLCYDYLPLEDATQQVALPTHTQKGKKTL